MIGLILISLIFVSPIVQIYLIKKRLKANTQISIISITILAIVLTIALSMIGLALYAIYGTNTKPEVKCDMTVPGVIGLDMLLIVFVIPFIGIIGGLRWDYKNRNSIVQQQDNPYLGTLKNSHQENLKQWN